MRYAINFTPPASDPLTLAASQWLGRNVFSGEAMEPPAIRGLGLHEIAFNTAVPRRYGFHGTLRPPFRLAEGVMEPLLLRHLMHFSGQQEPVRVPKLEVVRLGNRFALMPSQPCEALHHLAAAVVQHVDAFRAPMSEAELERADPGQLSAAQFANLHRWGHPFVMDEFRFHMTLTGAVGPEEIGRFEEVLRRYFEPFLERPLVIGNLALFVEMEPGAPFLVHSLHPLGSVASRRSA
jgi:putative phosphonate metabolism protein